MRLLGTEFLASQNMNKGTLLRYQDDFQLTLRRFSLPTGWGQHWLKHRTKPWNHSARKRPSRITKSNHWPNTTTITKGFGARPGRGEVMQCIHSSLCYLLCIGLAATKAWHVSDEVHVILWEHHLGIMQPSPPFPVLREICSEYRANTNYSLSSLY